MIQSGILTTIDSTTGQSTGVPVRGAWINFVQNNATKATVQTNIETGAYSVDVPLGKYTVKIAVGDVTGIQRAGQLFELKTGDKADTFQKWFYGETGSIDDDLLKQFKQISNDINASASRAESAEKGAKQIEINMQNNSIGDANGKWLKEGASKSDFLNTFGNYYSQDIMPYLKAGDTGLSYAKHFKTNNTGLNFANTGINENEFLYYEVQKIYSVNNAEIIEFKGYRGRPIYAQAYKRVDGTWTKPAVFYNQENTTVDSNGNIKKASPIIKLFDDHVEWNQDFKEDPIFEKLGIGVYKISNTNGLARGITHGDWYIETPKNRNGLPYFMVEWEQDDITDDVIIKVFDRKFDINIGDFVNGEPHDIGKDERWIDLRFHEQIYSLTNELPDINVPYHELWGIEPYIPPIVEPIEEDTALEDQRAF